MFVRVLHTCNWLILQFTLYFHQVLAEHASVYDMKHLAAKLDTDYILEWVLMDWDVAIITHYLFMCM